MASRQGENSHSAEGQETTGGLSVIVPTLGRSPWLGECLRALRQDLGDTGRIIVVCQATELPAEHAGLVDVVLACNEPRGFAAANNLALGHCRGPWVATVNDDVVVDRGWSGALLRCLEARPRAAAVQGIQRRLQDPSTLDGWGVGWNRHWQAVQLGHGRPLSAAPTAARQVFGVSATAAVYRRSALDDVVPRRGEIFDPRLFAYYEDVHLAVRLRAAGHQAWMIPEATARHAGSTSGRQMAHGGLQWIYGNRLLVLMDMLGRRFLSQWARIVGRDVVDAWRHLQRKQWAAVWGIVVGHGRAFLRIPSFGRWGAPRIGADELAKFSNDG